MAQIRVAGPWQLAGQLHRLAPHKNSYFFGRLFIQSMHSLINNTGARVWPSTYGYRLVPRREVIFYDGRLNLKESSVVFYETGFLLTASWNLLRIRGVIFKRRTVTILMGTYNDHKKALGICPSNFIQYIMPIILYINLGT